MSTIIDRVRREPVLISQGVAVVIGLLVAFGINLTEAQTAAVLAAAAFLGALVGRSQVKPMVDVLEHAVDGEVVAGPANELVAEGHVVREIVEPLDDNLRA